MNPVKQDILRRKDEIISEINGVFKLNMTITNWDVPEADDALAGKMIMEIMQEALDELTAKLEAGEFKDY
jgi:heme oxygenase